jgi:hypothetical protein
LSAPFSPPSPLDALSLTDEQKKQVEGLQKELDTGLVAIFNAEQKTQFKEMREGRPGIGLRLLPVGPLLPPGSLDGLKLTAEQKSEVEAFQKKIEDKLAKTLNEEQNKRLADWRDAVSRIGPGFPMPLGFAPPGFAGPNAATPAASGATAGTSDSATNQALNELQAAIDDPKTTPTQLSEKVGAVRASRKKARERLAAAQKELLLLLTPEQEAVLVRLGYLD